MTTSISHQAACVVHPSLLVLRVFHMTPAASDLMLTLATLIYHRYKHGLRCHQCCVPCMSRTCDIFCSMSYTANLQLLRLNREVVRAHLPRHRFL